MSSTLGEGFLELIMGPMFSGKTSRLLDIYNQCVYCDIPVLVVNYSGDKRYSDTMLSTHDSRTIPCIFVDRLSDIENQEENRELLEKSKVILINEGQFFSDLFEWTIKNVDVDNKKVYIAGLDGDFKREVFGDILKLIPYADKVTKLTSICSKCRNGRAGLFSHRISKEQQQKMIGSSEYTPLCRKCYLALNDVLK
jgi:thymidine kinase